MWNNCVVGWVYILHKLIQQTACMEITEESSSLTSPVGHRDHMSKPRDNVAQTILLYNTYNCVIPVQQRLHHIAHMFFKDIITFYQRLLFKPLWPMNNQVQDLGDNVSWLVKLCSTSKYAEIYLQPSLGRANRRTLISYG